MVETRIILDSPFAPWAAVLSCVAATVLIGIVSYRDLFGLRRGLRWWIGGLTLFGALLLAVLVINPKIVRQWEDPEKPLLIVLADASRSMLISDRYDRAAAEWIARRGGAPGEQTREAIVRMLLTPSEGSWLEKVQHLFRTSFLQFSEKVQSIALSVAGAPDYRVDPAGYATAISEGLEAVGGGHHGARPVAVVLLSDGAWNTGVDPASVARKLGKLGVPVYCVGIGDPRPPRDIMVHSLRAPQKSIVGDMLFLTAEVSASGMGAGRFRAELLEGEKRIAEKEVALPPTGTPVKVEFTHIPLEAGKLRFSVRVPPQEGEQNEGNNSASAIVEIADQRITTLLVDSAPDWEFRFLRSVLERDPAVRLTVCLLRPGIGPIAGPGYLTELPTDKKGFTEYDLIIIGDVARNQMPEAFLKEVADFVRYRGGALIARAGRNGGYLTWRGTPLEHVLPVLLEGIFAAPSPMTFRMELTQDGAENLMMRFAADPEENERIWRTLPELRWAGQVAGLAPGAVALAVHPLLVRSTGKQPLVAFQRVGSGKVLFCATDETWRWRKSVGDRYHYRFWAQAVRWLTHKAPVARDARVRMSLDAVECQTGQKINLETICLDDDGYPMINTSVSAEITTPDGEKRRIALRPEQGSWGIFRGELSFEKPGDYLIRPVVAAYGQEALPLSMTVTVKRPDLESRYLAQNRDALLAIAQASGGKYLELHQAEELAALLSSRREPRIITSEIAPFRSKWYFIFVTVVLSAAWLLRKLNGLA